MPRPLGRQLILNRSKLRLKLRANKSKVPQLETLCQAESPQHHMETGVMKNFKIGHCTMCFKKKVNHR